MIFAAFLRFLPVLTSAAAPWLLVALATWLVWTLQSAGAARQQADTLAQVVQAQRQRADRLSDSHAALRRSEAQARAKTARARTQAKEAHRRIESAARTETDQCPIDCLVPSP